MALSTAARMALWIRPWGADNSSKFQLCNLDFVPGKLFGPQLDEIMEGMADRKGKVLPLARPAQRISSREYSPPRSRVTEGEALEVREEVLVPLERETRNLTFDVLRLPVGGRLHFFSSCLGTFNTGQVCPINNFRRVFASSPSVPWRKVHFFSPVEFSKERDTGGVHSGTSCPKGSRTSFPFRSRKRSVLSRLFSSQTFRQKSVDNNRSRISKPVYCREEIQNGDYPHSEDNTSAGGFSSILPHPHSQVFSEVFKDCSVGSGNPVASTVSSPTLRDLDSPLHFYEGSLRHDGSASLKGNKSCPLPGRLAAISRVQRIIDRAYSDNSQTSSRSRLGSKSRKTLSSPIHKGIFSWIQNQHGSDDALSVIREKSLSNSCCETFTQTSPDIDKNLNEGPRADVLFYRASLDRKVSLSASV
ncbi:uncharacterized protein LOC130274496 [Hyla sarda]|uniref:uncharacterized protein LOC130274496 n=1 Tax=Hyla sarda TaxID=327740 RepID=UPI0024C31DBB|nr:uncharacterized protein LOC130274496 [Hyla sarda]